MREKKTCLCFGHLMGMLAMLGMLANTSDLQFERVWLLASHWFPAEGKYAMSISLGQSRHEIKMYGTHEFLQFDDLFNKGKHPVCKRREVSEVTKYKM